MIGYSSNLIVRLPCLPFYWILRQLNNGRAAMMGILALMVHEKLDNNPYMINGLLGSPVNFNAGY